MSIQTDFKQLESVKFEMKKLRLKMKELRKQEKEIEGRITEFLKAKEQPGVKYQGTALILQKSEAREKIKNKERDDRALALLTTYGIEDPEKVLGEIMEARKGCLVETEKLKYQKYKAQ